MNNENSTTKDIKTIGRLIAMVKQKLEVTIHLRSCPEAVITGDFDSFDSDGTNITILVVHGERGFRFINWQDVSFIEENLIGSP